MYIALNQGENLTWYILITYCMDVVVHGFNYGQFCKYNNYYIIFNVLVHMLGEINQKLITLSHHSKCKQHDQM